MTMLIWGREVMAIAKKKTAINLEIKWLRYSSLLYRSFSTVRNLLKKLSVRMEWNPMMAREESARKHIDRRLRSLFYDLEGPSLSSDNVVCRFSRE